MNRKVRAYIILGLFFSLLSVAILTFALFEQGQAYDHLKEIAESQTGHFFGENRWDNPILELLIFAVSAIFLILAFVGIKDK